MAGWALAMALFHLNAETGTRAGGQSGAAKHDYLARRGEYSRQPDKLVHLISGNMPAWAIARPRLYWECADEHERSNGRLFKELEGALPLELTHQQRVDLVDRFVRHVTTVAGGSLPFTMALHEGKPKRRGNPGNPHFHLELSERVNDGHDRSADTWFKRAAVGKGKGPADGGALKTDALKPKAWLESTRALWADLVNQALAAAGHDARVDHRSLKDQGVDRVPQVHMGPKALAFEARTGQPSRRRLEIEQRQADELAAADAALRKVQQLELEADEERQQAMRLRQVVTALEHVERQPVRAPAPVASAWNETADGLDLSSPLPFPDTRPPGGPYTAKKLPSGVVLHLRMPADRVAFVERADRIRMSATDALESESVAQALEVACAKWGTVTITGSPAFRRLVAEQAAQLGLLDQVDGLTDSEQRHGAAAAKRPRPR